jgi:hypothetical protein
VSRNVNFGITIAGVLASLIGIAAGGHVYLWESITWPLVTLYWAFACWVATRD